MGVIQRATVKACPHVWFERSEMKDRHLVTKRLREHVSSKDKLPILIFPEGTCINNTSVMMFKKGSFEIGGTIYPVAIKVRVWKHVVPVGQAAQEQMMRLQACPNVHAWKWPPQTLHGLEATLPGKRTGVQEQGDRTSVSCSRQPFLSRYDPQFGDAFWNSSKHGIVSYLLRIMTSWAIVCHVWYMPPVTRENGEDAVQFANRVKSAIARQGGLTELPWDGGLKRDKVKETFKEEEQKNYSKMIIGNGASSARLADTN
ncbi:Glycerol-3-phosphate acyltransferase 3 [Varanus komodoensis]|nr:Glycerol-3-phosphate acyltransferase 3 [Varanus komodoensis]